MDPGGDTRALSQSEIDALLSKIGSESNEPEPVEEHQWKVLKSYDFRRPDKLSKDQMRTLHLLHESLARLASSSLSAFLRTAVQLNLMSIEQGVYGEYVEQLPPDTILHIVSLDPLPGNVLIGMDLPTSMSAVDRLLGGAGNGPEPVKTPTEIELALVKTLVDSLLKSVRDAWNKVVDLSPVIRDVVLDPRFLQVALRSDPVVAVAFEMGMFHRSGTATMCLPYVALEPVLPKLNAQMWFSSSPREGVSHIEELRRGLLGLNVELMAELGGTRVSLEQLGQLKEGDVIILNRGTSQPLDLTVGKRRKFMVRPGMIGNKLAVQVVGKIEEIELLGKRE